MDGQDVLRRALNSRVGEALPSPTPLEPAPRLSRRAGRPVLLKREDRTPVFSFKLRGAYHRIALLDEEERRRGVLTASAGNHAQGVAWAAARFGLRARVVMPRCTPPIKVEAVRGYGAAVDLVGDDYAEAAVHCLALAEATGMTLVPAYDDPEVIAGQATVGLEILRQAGANLGTILVPVGGGGLAAGVAAVVKTVRPEVRVIGVEPDDADAMRRSLAAGKRVALERVGIFADGVAVRQVGELTFDLCRRYLDDCIVVDVGEICAAMRDVFEETRTVLEPAGALSVAALGRLTAAGASGAGAVVAIASGANVSFEQFAVVAAQLSAGREARAPAPSS